MEPVSRPLGDFKICPVCGRNVEEKLARRGHTWCRSCMQEYMLGKGELKED
jgi:hypothetical protein